MCLGVLRVLALIIHTIVHTIVFARSIVRLARARHQRQGLHLGPHRHWQGSLGCFSEVIYEALFAEVQGVSAASPRGA